MKKYWTCEVTYDGKKPFLFASTDMYVEADSELAAEELLKTVVEDSWAEISPHPAPKLLAVLPLKILHIRN